MPVAQKECFTVHEERHGDMPMLHVSGDVDIDTTPRLKAAIRLALRDEDSSLAIDLSRVAFLDSTGLQALISARRQTAERGGKVYLLGLSGHLQRVFNLLRLGRVFDLCEAADLPGS